MEKSIFIIGAGLAGLSAGCRAPGLATFSVFMKSWAQYKVDK